MIYANYAATSPALSPQVVSALTEYVGATHLNAGRNFEGLETGAIALQARKALATLFGAVNPLHVVFTSGATLALNMAIHGLVSPGDHVFTTGLEHNATARPLEALRARGVITLEQLPCAPDGTLDPDTFRHALEKALLQEAAQRGEQGKRILVMTHASNVLGTILPVEACTALAREHGVLTILDTAQTAGVLPCQVDADVIAFAGHKGLGALAGAGGLVIGERAVAALQPWVRGGTGSVSEALDMPAFLPDRFEPGTQNTIGLLSLAVSVTEILHTGVEQIRKREQALTARFLDGLSSAPRTTKVRICGTGDPDRCVPVVSVVFPGRDAGDVSRCLFERFGIVTRSGLHCAPLAHTTAGTFPGGTVRFSFGRGTTPEDIDAILDALHHL